MTRQLLCATFATLQKLFHSCAILPLTSCYKYQTLTQKRIIKPTKWKPNNYDLKPRFSVRLGSNREVSNRIFRNLWLNNIHWQYYCKIIHLYYRFGLMYKKMTFQQHSSEAACNILSVHENTPKGHMWPPPLLHGERGGERERTQSSDVCSTGKNFQDINTITYSKDCLEVI